jgi:dTDP-glucose 4,6-dehydratase
MSETFFITGGAGFIGSNFVRLAYRTTGARLVVFDKLTYAGHRGNLAELEADPRFVFVQGDIADAEAVAEAFAVHRPSAVFNFAAESHVDRSIEDPGAFVRTNVTGTFVLLDAARRLLAGASDDLRRRFRFLHVSTDEVYGSLGPTGFFTEETPYAPNSPYSASKAGADHLVRAFHETYGLPTLLTNCSNNYGPYQFPEKLVPLMLLNAIEGRNLPIYGDGQNVRDWLFVEDHCEGLLAVWRQGQPGGKYNLGGECEKTNLELVRTLCELLEAALPARDNLALVARGVTSYRELETFVPDRPGHDRRYAIDITKIRRELGWTPRHDFRSGLAATVRWYLDHRPWCEEVQARGYRRERLGLTGAPAPLATTPAGAGGPR